MTWAWYGNAGALPIANAEPTSEESSEEESSEESSS